MAEQELIESHKQLYTMSQKDNLDQTQQVQGHGQGFAMGTQKAESSVNFRATQ